MIIKDQKVYDWLEANADKYGLHGHFARGTGGVQKGVLLKLMQALDAQPSAVTEYQAAYGLLWRMRTTDKAIREARRSLFNAIGKEGQRAGLDWALATFGPHEAPTLEELP